jgi:hypothetical protein
MYNFCIEFRIQGPKGATADLNHKINNAFDTVINSLSDKYSTISVNIWILHKHRFR